MSAVSCVGGAEALRKKFAHVEQFSTSVIIWLEMPGHHTKVLVRIRQRSIPCRVPVLLEDSSKVVNFLLKVGLRIDDPSGPVVETSHHTSLHMGQMMRLEMEISVHTSSLSP